MPSSSRRLFLLVPISFFLANTASSSEVAVSTSASVDAAAAPQADSNGANEGLERLARASPLRWGKRAPLRWGKRSEDEEEVNGGKIEHRVTREVPLSTIENEIEKTKGTLPEQLKPERRLKHIDILIRWGKRSIIDDFLMLNNGESDEDVEALEDLANGLEDGELSEEEGEDFLRNLRAPARFGKRAPARFGKRAPARFGKRAPARFGKRAPARFGKRAPARFGKRAPARFGKRAPARFGKRAPARFGKRFSDGLLEEEDSEEEYPSGNEFFYPQVGFQYQD